MSEREISMVRVEWVDSRSTLGEWTLYSEITDDYLLKDSVLDVTTVGWLFHEDADKVIVVGNVGRDQCMGGIAIPRVAIKSITPLTKKRVTTGTVAASGRKRAGR